MNAPRAAVGTSDNPNAQLAGREAAERALAEGGRDAPPSLVLQFCTARQDPVKLTGGVREVIGESVPIFGGNANGVISNDFIGYDGFQVGVAALWLGAIDFQLFKQQGVAFNELETGAGLGAQIRQGLRDPAEDSLIFIYDSVNRLKGHFVMNLATPLLDGMNRELEPWPAAAGARVMGDMKFNPTHQWCGSEILQDSAVALLLHAPLRMHTTVIHGCRPASAYHTVTASDGPTVLEIDGAPALERVGEILGPELRENHDRYKFFVTLGVNHGEMWGPFREENYANKMCVGVDEARGGLVLAEPLPAGTRVQLMRRNFDPDYSRVRTMGLIDRILEAGREPVFGLYLNCAGRGASYYGNDEEEASYVQHAIDGRFPLLGAYQAGEITRVNDTMQLLDWTGVLNIFSIERP